MSLFQNLKPTLEKYGTLTGGRAICGAPISGYFGKTSLGCSYEGVTHLKISKNGANIVSGRGKTAHINQICGKSDTVIVQLGDNNLNNSENTARDAAKLVREIIKSGKKCIWIGPASIGGKRCAVERNKKMAASKSIKTTVEKLNCKFIDSFSATDSNPPRSKDPMCIHYPGLYPVWAKAIKQQIKNTFNSEKSRSQGTVNKIEVIQ